MRARTPAGARAAAVGAVLWSLWLWIVQWTGLRSGLIDRGMIELVQHETPPFMSWSGGVHPPLYSVFLWAAEHGAGPAGLTNQELVFVHGALVHVALVALVGAFAFRTLGPWPGAATAWLLAFGTESLRPFEHYPISALFTTLAALASLDLARRGGRRRVVIAAALGFSTFMLHLSPWFFLGPLLLLLWIGLPHRRWELAVAACAVFVAFMATTWPGLYRQLAEGGPGGSEAGTVTVGWLNPWLLAPLGLWLVPRVRAGREAWPLVAAAASIALYAVITFGLQLAQIADGQPYPSSLHYFSLVEPICVLSVVGALAASFRVGLAPWLSWGVTVGLVLTQLWRWQDGMTWIWRSQRGLWISALQPWNWL